MNQVTPWQRLSHLPARKKIGYALFVVYVAVISAVVHRIPNPVHAEVSEVISMVGTFMMLGMLLAGGFAMAKGKVKTGMVRILKGFVLLQTGLALIKMGGDDIYAAYTSNPSGTYVLIVSGVITYFMMKRVINDSPETPSSI